MKKLAIITFVFFISLLQITSVYALSLDNNEFTLAKGESATAELYLDVEQEITKVNFSLVFTSYDVPASFVVQNGFKHTISKSVKNTVTFPTSQTGNIKLGTVEFNVSKSAKATSATINIHNATATTKAGKTIKLNSQQIKVVVGESSKTDGANATQTNKETYDLLSEIQSDIVKIKVLENVYSYDVTISDSVEELDLKPIAKDNKYKIEVSTQKISELKDNKITINVSKDNKEKQEYVVNVKVLKTEKVTIDKSEFKSDNGYKSKWVAMTVVLGMVLVAGVVISKRK